jgi:hypothetical protein
MQAIIKNFSRVINLVGIFSATIYDPQKKAIISESCNLVNLSTQIQNTSTIIAPTSTTDWDVSTTTENATNAEMNQFYFYEVCERRPRK